MDRPDDTMGVEADHRAITVRVLERWERYRAGETVDTNVVIFGEPSTGKSALVSSLVPAEIGLGAKAILFDMNARHRQLATDCGGVVLDRLALEAFVDPADALSRVLADHDLVVVDVGSNQMGAHQSEPPSRPGAVLLRYLLDAQRVEVQTRVVIVVDPVWQVLATEPMALWARCCLARSGLELSHVVTVHSATYLHDGSSNGDARRLFSTQVVLGQSGWRRNRRDHDR